MHTGLRRSLLLSLLVLALGSSARAGNVQAIHDFQNPPLASVPYSSLVAAADGNLYGTTWSGGMLNGGTFFRMDVNGNVTTLHEFNPALEGGNPTDVVLPGADGFFYVITRTGGPGAICDFVSRVSCGTLVRLDSRGTLQVLHVFDQVLDARGAYPTGGVVTGPDGALYGAADQGAAGGRGLLYRYDVTTGSYSVLHAFDGVEGVRAGGPLSLGQDGRLWGTASYTTDTQTDGGLVFAVDVTGTYTPIHHFDASGAEGLNPTFGVVQATDGRFYGTTTRSGADRQGPGTVFRMDAAGRLTTLRVFQDAGDLRYPSSPLMLASDGFLYGMTDPGYDSNVLVVKATIFRVGQDGSFVTVGRLGAAEGIFPHGALVEGPAGALFGTAWMGGAYGKGTAFRFARGLQVESVSLPALVVGSDPVTGTVTLTETAPAGGLVVALKSSQGAVKVPATVVVAAGARSASFAATTSTVTKGTPATVTASVNGASQSATVTVLPMPTLMGFLPSQNPVYGQDDCSAKITLSGPAPRAGAVVKITSSNPALVSVPATVTVPGGMSTASFAIFTMYTNKVVTVKLTAAYGAQTMTYNLTVIRPPVISTFVLSPASVKGGTSSTGIVTIDVAAGPAGAWVLLKSSNTAAKVPAGVFVPANANSATFPVTTVPQARKLNVNIDATLRGTKRATLTVIP